MSIGTAPSQSGEHSIAFGSFELFPHRRVLTDDGRPIRLGSRALDILLLLVDKAGQIVGKEELIAHVWPKTFVEEANLRVHLAALRKILGEGQGGKRYIVNAVGRGYSFVAPLSIRTGPHHAHQQAPSTAGGAPLPAPLGPLLGRSEAVGTIASRLLQHRFVTVCGSPGIGKTSVALAVAEHLAPSFDNHVRFVDLAPITDASQLMNAVASAIGVPVIWPNVMQSLLDHLRGNPKATCARPGPQARRGRL